MKTIKELIVEKVIPWKDFNDEEGHIEGTIEGHEVFVYAIFWKEDEWKEYAKGDVLKREVWIERSGEAKIVPAGTPLELKQKSGVNYEAVGEVTHVDDELVRLRSVFEVTVDLESGTPEIDELLRSIKIGDHLFVAGALQIDLHPDFKDA